MINMNFSLSNEALTVGFSTTGGTLTSIIANRDCVEYLWQGDKTYWSGQAPVLFPICGSLRDDEAIIGGNQRTRMPRHGIVRKKEFRLEDKTDRTIAFSIESDTASREQFPYDFKLITEYALDGGSLVVTYRVRNTGDTVMPYFIGGHPGFNCPLFPGETYTDYLIEFKQEETCTVPTPVTATGLIDVERRTPFLDHQKILPLDHHLFDVDAVILDSLQSRSLKFYSRHSGRGLSLDFGDFPCLILWSSPNGGDFVAIEPWMGLSTCSDEGNVFEEKRHVQSVLPGEEKTYAYRISLL